MLDSRISGLPTLMKKLPCRPTFLMFRCRKAGKLLGSKCMLWTTGLLNKEFNDATFSARLSRPVAEVMISALDVTHCY